MIGEAWALPPDSNVQRYEPLTSATGTNFHACYLKRSYKSCAVPIQDQYVAWRSDDPARSAASGPARCPGSTSCIETGVDFGGGVEGCGYAPLVGIASNAGAFIPPVWWSEDTLLEPSLHSAEDCQTICRDYKDAAGNATCEYFSYEWETFKYNVEQIDVFRCPGGDAACVDTISTANHLVRTRGCAIGSDEPFCAVCQPSFSMKNGICQKCDESAEGSLIMFSIFVIVVVIALTVVQMKCKESCVLWIAVMRLSWPRVNQSFRLIVSSYQLISEIPKQTQINIAPDLMKIFDTVSGIVDLDISALPGISCSFDSYYSKWVFEMMLPPIAIFMLWVISKVHMARLRRVTMPTPSGLGSKQLFAFKMNRTVIAAKLQANYYAYMFAIVFLRFPATVKAVFELLKPCRTVREDLGYLNANYHVDCTSDTYTVFYLLAWLFFPLYPVGIPLYLWTTLLRNLSSVHNNPHYVGIAHLRPIFQFYKPACCYFEIYFWLEKVCRAPHNHYNGQPPNGSRFVYPFVSGQVLLIGCASLFRPGSVVQWLFSMAVTQSYLLLIVFHMRASPLRQPHLLVCNMDARDQMLY
jgi:hypothetical protein